MPPKLPPKRTLTTPFSPTKNRGLSPPDAHSSSRSSRFEVAPIFGIPEIEGSFESKAGNAESHKESRFSFGGFKTPRLTLAEQWKQQYGEKEETVETEDEDEESRLTDEKSDGSDGE